MTARLVFDIEADGLLDEATEIWCATTEDLDTGEVIHYEPDQLELAWEVMDEAALLVGHNVISYDLPLIAKWYPPGLERPKVLDTVILSRLLWPDRMRPKGMTGKGGPHSLKSWGYRLGHRKPEHDDWSQYSEAMRFRNMEDVAINVQILRALEKEAGQTLSDLL